MARAQTAAPVAPPKNNMRKVGAWSAETAEEEYAESQSSGGGADFLKLKVGKNVVRFMTPREGEDTPFKIVHQHYIDVPGGKAVSFNCPRMHKAGRCPACDRQRELSESGNPADYDRAGKLLPRRRVFANVVDRGDPERGVVILPMGKTIHEQLLALRKNEEAGGDFTDVDQGFDIIIERSGEGLKTEYKVFCARKNSPLGNDEWLEQMHDLNRVARVESLEELRKKMGEEPAPRAPAARPAARAATPAAAPARRAAAPAAKAPTPARTAEDDAEQTEEEPEE